MIVSSQLKKCFAAGEWTSGSCVFDKFLVPLAVLQFFFQGLKSSQERFNVGIPKRICGSEVSLKAARRIEAAADRS